MLKLTAAKKIVILKDVGQEETEAGIFVPPVQSERDKPEIGIVEQVGSGTPPLPLKKGDKIIYKKYMSNRISISGEEFNFITFDDIIGKVTK